MLGFKKGLYMQPTEEYNSRQMTTPERLRLVKNELKKKLAEVTEALDALDKNPELERILVLIERASF